MTYSTKQIARAAISGILSISLLFVGPSPSFAFSNPYLPYYRDHAQVIFDRAIALASEEEALPPPIQGGEIEYDRKIEEFEKQKVDIIAESEIWKQRILRRVTGDSRAADALKNSLKQLTRIQNSWTDASLPNDRVEVSPPVVSDVRQLLPLQFNQIAPPPADCIDVESNALANEAKEVVTQARNLLDSQDVQYDKGTAQNLLKSYLRRLDFRIRDERESIGYIRGPFEYDAKGNFREVERCLPFLESYLDWSVSTMYSLRVGWLHYRERLGLEITKSHKEMSVAYFATSLVASLVPASLRRFTPQPLWQDDSWRDWLVRTMVELPTYEAGPESLSDSRWLLLHQEYQRAKEEGWVSENGRLLVDQFDELYQSRLIRRARKLQTLVYHQVDRPERDLDANLKAVSVILPAMKFGTLVTSLGAFGQLPAWSRTATAFAIEAGTLVTSSILITGTSDDWGMIVQPFISADQEAKRTGKNRVIAAIRIGSAEALIVGGAIVFVKAVPLIKAFRLKRAEMALKAVAK